MQYSTVVSQLEPKNICLCLCHNFFNFTLYCLSHNVYSHYSFHVFIYLFLSLLLRQSKWARYFYLPNFHRNDWFRCPTAHDNTGLVSVIHQQNFINKTHHLTSVVPLRYGCGTRFSLLMHMLFVVSLCREPHKCYSIKFNILISSNVSLNIKFPTRIIRLGSKTTHNTNITLFFPYEKYL